MQGSQLEQTNEHRRIQLKNFRLEKTASWGCEDGQYLDVSARLPQRASKWSVAGSGNGPLGRRRLLSEVGEDFAVEKPSTARTTCSTNSSP
jgi:hypothetical protein